MNVHPEIPVEDHLITGGKLRFAHDPTTGDNSVNIVRLDGPDYRWSGLAIGDADHVWETLKDRLVYIGRSDIGEFIYEWKGNKLPFLTLAELRRKHHPRSIRKVPPEEMDTTQLSYWLHKNGWNGDYYKVGKWNVFTNPHNPSHDILAYVEYAGKNGFVSQIVLVD